MRIVIGYGNDLRGEDGFGVEVIRKLQLQSNAQNNTKLIEVYQLTPELCLELLEASEIIFIDAAFSKTNHYKLACHIMFENQTNLSHHISPKMIISLLNNVYNIYPKFQVYSMFTNQFDKIGNEKLYREKIEEVRKFIKTTINTSL